MLYFHNSKNYLKYIPIIYPILVFFGYLNYDFYYKRFQIDIFNYLSLNEFLFSFISISYPIILLLIGFQLINVFIELLQNKKKKYTKDLETEKEELQNRWEIKPKKSLYISKLSKAKTNFRNSNIIKGFGFSFLYLLFFLFYLIIYSLPLLILYYGYLLIISPLLNLIDLENFNYDVLKFIDSPHDIFITVTSWLIPFIYILFAKFKNKDISVKTFKSILIFVFFCILISSLLRYQNIRFNAIINGKSDKEVSFLYVGKEVNSDKTKRLLGITSNYIFLRDIENETNYIYNMNDVRHLRITSVDDLKSKK